MIINFGKSISSPALSYASLAVIIFDVFIRVNTSLYKKGNLVNKRLEIIENYLQKRIYLDLLTIFPLLLINLSNSRILIFGSLSTFAKIVDFKDFFKKVEERFYLKRAVVHLLSLVELLIFIIFVGHIFSSIWIFCGNLQLYIDPS